MSGENRATFEQLVTSGTLQVSRGAIFGRSPGPMPASFDFGRVEGMLLGLAVGDALGNTTESLLPGMRSQQYGEIKDYLPNRHAGGRPVGVPSDDTQLAFWTLEAILQDGGLNPSRLVERFASRRIFGIGATVREFLCRYEGGTPSYEAGARSAGNGALMRIAPVLVPHLDTGTADLWVDAALAASITHNDPGSTGACVAFVHMLWELLRMDRPPEPQWWVDSYVEVARQVEGEANYETRGGSFPKFRGPIWGFVVDHLPSAYAAGLSVREACDSWWSGAYLLETVPCVLYILMRHGSDPEQAIVRAVNDTKDNDTIAAIVGAAVGALHGRDALPSRWLRRLLGRTAAADDGRVFALLAEARETHDAVSCLRTRLSAVEVGDGLPAGDLMVFPLLQSHRDGEGYLLLDQALADGLLEITEVSAAGSVPELKVINRSGEMVLLLEGDQLVGAKQNRTVNTTLLAAAHSELTIPVSCVESGRWHSVSDRFAASRRHSHPSLRREKVRSVHASLRRGQGYHSDQHAVRAEVSRAAASVGSTSSTSDYEAVHDAAEREISSLAKGLELPQETVGVAVVIGGRLSVVELFDGPETLRRVWGKLARGYGLEAVYRRRDARAGRPAGAEEVRALLREVATTARIEPYPSPGLGRDLRLDIRGASGAALVAAGEVVHCALFCTEPSG